MPAAIHLHQIAYSPQTWDAVAAGFTPLDNRANPRPDWYELDPIRRHVQAMLRNSAEGRTDGDWHGFFSPKFTAKTGLDAAQVRREVQRAEAAGADVVLFSPQPDMGAFFLNVFEQGEAFDPGLIAATEGWLAHAGLATPPLAGLVMDTRTTVFSNYFVARPAFWREWMRWIDALWQACEDGPEAVRGPLLQSTTYPGAAQRKVFIQERIASLVLTLQPHWRTHAANPFRMAWSASRLREHPDLAVMSDALKRAHRDLGWPGYLQAYARLRERFKAMAAG